MVLDNECKQKAKSLKNNVDVVTRRVQEGLSQVRGETDVTAVSFNEEGIDMAMAVTDEDNQVFPEGNNDSMHEITDAGSASESEEEEGNDERECLNNNATREYTVNKARNSTRGNDCDEAVPSTSSGVTQPELQDKEELQFMEHFALFMEKRGFIQKVDEVSARGRQGSTK